MAPGICVDGVWNKSHSTTSVTVCLEYLCLLSPSALFSLSFVIFILFKWFKCPPIIAVPFDIIHLLNLSARIFLIFLLVAETLIGNEEVDGPTVNDEEDSLRIMAFASVCIAMFLVIILTEIRRRTHRPMCPLLFTFLLTSALGYSVRFYGNLIRFINSNHSRLHFGYIFLSGTILFLFFLNFVTECCSRYSDDRLVRKKRMHCPEEYAPILSKLTYVWLDKFIYRWFKKEMTEETVFDIRWEDECAINTDSVETKFFNKVSQDKERQIETIVDSISDSSQLIVESRNGNGTKISPTWILFQTLMKCYGLNLVLACSLKVINDVALYMMPFLLKLLLQTVQENAMSNWMGYVFAFAFLICGTISSLCLNYSYFIASSTGIQVRAALMGMIYRKTLRSNSEVRSQFTSGEIINLMSVDAERIMNAVTFTWNIVSCPLQFILAFILLYNEMGNAVFAGLGVIVGFFPVNGLLLKLMYQFSDIELKWKDDRVKILTEILTGIKVLKMYAWEKSFISKVTGIRNKEMKYILRESLSYTFITVIWEILPFLILLATFLTFIHMGGVNILTAERVFVSLSLFNLLRFPIVSLPWFLTDNVSASVSLKRIAQYLIGDELKNVNRCHFNDRREDPLGDAAVIIHDGYFSWKRDDKIILNKINIEIGKGRLVAIVGKVGTGKSSLISAILGEMHTISGSVKIKGKIAYVSQEAWIQNKSLKDNILFTKKYNEELYKKVIKSCALERDLDQLPGRDETEIGERGINLSGGQKQRVSLARSVYQNRDIYLLDDPLSAVDAHVGEYLFENVISNNGILNGKTRILVTHGLNWLPKVDEVFVLDNNGHISERGSFKELLKTSDEFVQWIQDNVEHNKNKTLASNVLNIEGESNIRKESPLLKSVSLCDLTVERSTEFFISSLEEGHHLSHVSTEGFANNHGLPSRFSGINVGAQLPSNRFGNGIYLSHISLAETRKSSKASFEMDRVVKPLCQLTEEEEAMSGKVKWKTYLLFIKSRGLSLCIVTILMYMTFTGIQIFSNMWLEWFTADKIFQNMSIDISQNFSNVNVLHKMQSQTHFYIVRYMYIGLGMTLAVSLFWMCFTMSSIRASKVIHKELLYSILRSPMRFFDATPSGRIINRFSKDIDTLDHSIPIIVSDIISCFFTFLGSIIVIIYVTPWFAAVIPAFLIIYYFIQLFYMPTSRQSRRLDSIASSPVFNHFTETLQGISLIRAFNEQTHFQNLNEKLVDRSSKFKFIQFSSDRWLTLRIEMLGNLIVFGSVLFANINRNSLSVSLIGLSISSSLQVTEILGWLVKQYTNLETNSVALERLREYSQVPSEAEWNSDYRPPELWPNSGSVIFENFELKYRDNLPLVLKKINLSLNAGERHGIVGRTGAGKSSLNSGLFRLMEAAGGSIKIDGIDIASLGLHDLRRSLTILPQEPVIFCGTIRDNLDPFNVHSDDELYQCLETAHLQQWVSTLVEGMDYDCGEGGANLSTGQKQLLCLARAVLRKSKVLILDEATASVDVETDGLVMETIREFFKESTVIIIAHRINTIVDVDKVVVMEDGEVIEFGEPKKLLSNPKSVFKSLHDQSSSGDL